MGEVLEEAVDEGTRQALEERNLAPGPAPEGRGDQLRRGQGSRIQGRCRGAAGDHRAGLRQRRDRPPGRRGDRGADLGRPDPDRRDPPQVRAGDRGARPAGRRRRRHRLRGQPRRRRAERGDVRQGPPPRDRREPLHPGLRGAAGRQEAGRARHRRGDLPRGVSEPRACRQAGRLRGRRQVDRAGRGARGERRSSPRSWASRTSRACATRSRARPSRSSAGCRACAPSASCSTSWPSWSISPCRRAWSSSSSTRSGSRCSSRSRPAARTIRTRTSREDELKAEYRAIAERRVRLGLLFAEIGRARTSR